MTSDASAAADRLLRLASQLRQSGRVVEAIDAYERLLALRPGLANSWFNLGWLYRRAGRHEQALAAYERALALGVADAEEVHVNRAVIFSDHLARPDEAEHELGQALALNPRYVPAWLNLGNLHEDRGQREPALAAYQQVLQIDGHNALALARLAQLHRIDNAADPLVARLRQAIARPQASAAECADLGFALGKALDDAGAYDDAFAAYVAANRASSHSGAVPRYDRRAHERFVDDLIAAFPAGGGASASPDAEPAPALFICGMFRSGSTLVEQILGAHPMVRAGGELDIVPSLVRERRAPLSRGQLLQDPVRLQALRRAYRERIAQLHPGAAFVTDKRPDNFLYIGLIETLFPSARIVHTRRNALDNGLSIFFLHLGHSMPHALDLADIGHWYRQYRRLMTHWSGVYTGAIHDIDYDALVVDPRPQIEGLLAFCGLPWDDACLEFHNSRAVVKTASVWQVRQPLYQRSSGRWRHYERHLQPLRDALGTTG